MNKIGKIGEAGAASIFIELKDGIITVTHGTDKVVLEQWTANQGDWNLLWGTINTLKVAAK